MERREQEPSVANPSACSLAVVSWDQKSLPLMASPPVRVASAIHTGISMLLPRKWTEPSPNRNGTPTRWGLEVESASNTPGVLGPVGPAWHISRVTSAPKLGGSCRKGFRAPVGPPIQVEYDSFTVR